MNNEVKGMEKKWKIIAITLIVVIIIASAIFGIWKTFLLLEVFAGIIVLLMSIPKFKIAMDNDTGGLDSFVYGLIGTFMVFLGILFLLWGILGLVMI